MSAPRKVVIAVDQGDPSRIAFLWSLKNLLKGSDHVLLLSAYSYSPASSLETLDISAGGEYAVPIVVPNDSTQEQELVRLSQEVVDSYLQIIRQANIPSEAIVVKGDPGAQICLEASKFNADLVVVGTHEYGFIKRTIWGSVSTHVVHHSHAPVVVVRGGARANSSETPGVDVAQAKTVAVAVDNSKEAFFAFSWALENLPLDSAKLELIHVTVDQVTPPEDSGSLLFVEGFVPADGERAAVEELKTGEALLNSLMQSAKQKHPKVECEGRIVSGGTGEQLCAALESVHADLVVVGSRAANVLLKTVAGSVSDHLVHNSPCPVVVAKLPSGSPGPKKD